MSLTRRNPPPQQQPDLEQAGDVTAMRPPDKAVSKVAELWEAEKRLSRQRIDLAASMGQVEDRAGQELLDRAMATDGPAPVDAISAAVVKTRAEIETLDAAIDRCRRQRVEEIPGLWQAGADDLRHQAASIRAEADRRAARTDELLAELLEHEGCRYAPEQEQQPLMSIDPETMQPRVGAPTIRVVHVARTEQMRREADRYDELAAQAMARQVENAAGFTVTGSVDDVMAAAAEWPADRVGPGLVELHRWGTAGLKVQVVRRSQVRPDAPAEAGPVAFEVVTTPAGGLDVERSRVFLPKIDTPGDWAAEHEQERLEELAREDPCLVRGDDGVFRRLSPKQLARAVESGEVVTSGDGISLLVPKRLREPAPAGA